MAKTMQERFEQAKRLQKEIADARSNKKVKHKLPEHIILNNRNTLLGKQLGLCAICGKEIMEGTRLYHLDHDHTNGEIRGVLCHNCNVGLGHFKDDPKLLMLAINYLNKFRSINEKLIYKEETLFRVKMEMPPPITSHHISNEEFNKMDGKERIRLLQEIEERANHWYQKVPNLITFERIV